MSNTPALQVRPVRPTIGAEVSLASILDASVVPECGGDTMWSNLQAGYDALAEPMKRLCDRLIAYHPPPLEGGLVGGLGQPRNDALRRQRLRE